MTRFEALEGSSGAKGKSLYKLAEVEESYPYVTSKQAMEILSEWINLDGITEKNLERANHQLQGRLRYVFGFLRFLFAVAFKRYLVDPTTGTANPSVVLERKNYIFEQGLIDLSLDINHTIKRQWEKVMKITNTKPVTDTMPPTSSNLRCKPMNLYIMTNTRHSSCTYSDTADGPLIEFIDNLGCRQISQ